MGPSPPLPAPTSGGCRGVQSLQLDGGKPTQPQNNSKRRNGRLRMGAGRVNWGGDYSCLAVNLNVVLHRWEWSSQAAMKLPLKLT